MVHRLKKNTRILTSWHYEQCPSHCPVLSHSFVVPSGSCNPLSFKNIVHVRNFSIVYACACVTAGGTWKCALTCRSSWQWWSQEVNFSTFSDSFKKLTLILFTRQYCLDIIPNQTQPTAVKSGWLNSWWRELFLLKQINCFINRSALMKPNQTVSPENRNLGLEFRNWL